MISIGIFEAKADLGQLAQSATEGEVVVLTRRGKPLAEIRSPTGETAQANTQQAIDDLRQFRRKNRVGAFDIAETVAEGRRRCAPAAFSWSIARSALPGCLKSRPMTIRKPR